MYDGFISYSHASDGMLAPRLQAGLQRFAKPWWRRRALRMFRDDASLAANPRLWASIQEAMDQAEWFVLLLSPEAAVSTWVDREVEWWLAHKDPSRIIPVLTGGDFDWDEGVVSNAAPPALHRAFSEEPRWVDLRFAKQEDQLDLSNPAFAGAVADIASAVRGVPKDELASEEVRQHRRTIRTAWAAALALLGLAVFSVVVAAFALDQQAEAERQAEIAEQNEVEARANAAREAEARAEAEQARQEAVLQAAISEMRALEARSVAEIESDPELATLLALLATAVAPSPAHRVEVIPELTNAVATNRLVARFENPIDPRDSYNYGAISADGSTVFAVQQLDRGHQVVAIDVESGAVTDTYHVSIDDGEHTDWVAVSASGLLAFDLTSEVDGGSIHVVDTATGATEVLPLAGCSVATPPHFSPDGRYLSFMDGTADCRNQAAADWALVYDTTTWEEVLRWEKPGAVFEWIQFGAGSSTALLTSCGEPWLCDLELVSFPTLDPIDSYLGFYPNLSSSGELLVSRYGESESAFGTTEIRDLTTGGIAYIEDRQDSNWSVTPDIGFPYHASPDGALVAIIVEPVRSRLPRTSQSVVVIDTETGAPIVRLSDFRRPLSGPGVVGISWTGDGERLLTSHPGGLLLWDVKRVTDRFALAEALDPVELGLEILTRGFTDAECQSFTIDICPTSIEELREMLNTSP